MKPPCNWHCTNLSADRQAKMIILITCSLVLRIKAWRFTSGSCSGFAGASNKKRSITGNQTDITNNINYLQIING